MEVNGASHRENVQVSSVAAANGAIPMPPDVDINKVNGNGTNGNEWGKKTW
jgi:hypothetical protein